MERAGSVLQRIHGDLIISKQRLEKVKGIELVRMNRQQASQTLCFTSPPFVLCGLPIRRLPNSQLLYERRNGQFVLQVTGHPDYGVPFGQDRIVPIFLATLAVQQKSQVIRFRAEGQGQGRSSFAVQFSERSPNLVQPGDDQPVLSNEFENVIVLSDEFYAEITAHPIPTDLDAVRVLSASPAILDLFMWLSYRCFSAKGEETIPIFGPYGLAAQLGNVEYARPRRFREKLEQWIVTIQSMWPQCPARVTRDGSSLIVNRAAAVAPSQIPYSQYFRSWRALGRRWPVGRRPPLKVSTGLWGRYLNSYGICSDNSLGVTGPRRVVGGGHRSGAPGWFEPDCRRITFGPRQLKRRMAASSPGPKRSTPPAFVELMAPGAASRPEYTFELEGPQICAHLQLTAASP